MSSAAPGASQLDQMTPFERAQLRAKALEALLPHPLGRYERGLHASFVLAVERLAGWYVAPDGTPFPAIAVATCAVVEGDGAMLLVAYEPAAGKPVAVPPRVLGC